MNKFVRNGMDLGKSFFKYNGIWLLCLKIEREVDVNCLVLLSPSVRKVWIEIWQSKREAVSRTRHLL